MALAASMAPAAKLAAAMVWRQGGKEAALTALEATGGDAGSPPQSTAHYDPARTMDTGPQGAPHHAAAAALQPREV
eukprot:gene17079-biopygen3783